MIADLDETIKQLLVAELPIKNGEIDVKFDQPTREWSAKLAKPTINLFLYDVRENNVLRQHQWQRMDNGRTPIASMKRTPMRVDCYYMLTTWASEPDDEHRLLTRALMALFRYPTLPDERLVGTLQNPPFDIQASLARHDKLTNPAEVWSSLDNELRPSISYLVTLALDPWSEFTGPAVRTLTLRTGQAAQPQKEQIDPAQTMSEMVFVGGTVAKKDTPEAHIQVAVKGTGWIGMTDEDGRFTLGSLPPGQYTLVAWPAKGKPQEKKITVPSTDYNISL
jgi:hypothetical protein